MAWTVVENITCKATTKAGTPCKLPPTVSGDGLCYTHSQRKTATRRRPTRRL
jgi:hypothetical protein